MLEIIDEIRPRKEERSAFREIASYVIGLLALVALGIAVTWHTKANALPIAQTVTQDGQKIVLTDEECRLDAVKNLKHRATWTENGKVYEGCYGVHPAGVVLGYFADKTVVMIPVQTFTQVIGV